MHEAAASSKPARVIGTMRRPNAPLYVWRIAFRLDVAGAEPEMLRELEANLSTFAARAFLDGQRLTVRMRVVGHVGPASAIGDAAMMLGHKAAQVGLDPSLIQVVHAERMTASDSRREKAPP